MLFAWLKWFCYAIAVSRSLIRLRPKQIDCDFYTPYLWRHNSIWRQRACVLLLQQLFWLKIHEFLLYICFLFLRVSINLSRGSSMSSVESFSVCGCSTGRISFSQILVYELRKNNFRLVIFLCLIVIKLKNIHIFLKGNTVTSRLYTQIVSTEKMRKDMRGCKGMRSTKYTYYNKLFFDIASN